MKKKTFFTFVILIYGLVACNSNDDDIINDKVNNNTLEETPLIVKQIQGINDSVYNKHVVSRVKPKDVLLASADICGALEGGRWGIKGGSFIGSLCPVIGTVGGGFIGGLIGASFGSIGASYVEYCRQNCGGYSIILPTVEDISKAYCMNYDINSDNGSYKNDYENILELPFGLDSLENIGKYHNLTLTTLINKGNSIMLLGDDDEISNPADDYIDNPGTLVVLSDFERSVICSDDYNMNFNQYMYVISENKGFRSSENDIVSIIVNLYIDAIECFDGVSDINDVVDLTNEYIYLVEINDELTEIEKYHIYMALSVGVYSYKFWANFNEDNDR